LFGTVWALVSITHSGGITSEMLWLHFAGFSGALTGAFMPSYVRPYDLAIGLLFIIVGLLGILNNFVLTLVGQPRGLAPNAIDGTAILGLQKKGEKAPSFMAGMNRPLLLDKHLF
jgi:hypothetical protein